MRRFSFLLLAAAASLAAAALPAQGRDRVVPPRPVVFDHDADFDDTAALAALAAQHVAGRIELKAVTITNNGAGYPDKGYRHTRCLLDQLGLTDVPVADATYALPNAFPDFLRQAIDGLLDRVIGDCAAGHARPSRSAQDLLAGVLAGSPGQITLIATGPVTNVARAFERVRAGRGWPAALLVRSLYVQGGAFNSPLDNSLLPPGFDGSQAINTWGDPAAMQAVVSSLAPLQLRLVPHDATDFVPVRLDYVDLLAANPRTPAAAYVARLMNDPLVRGAVTAGQPAFWWDPLAAVSALGGLSDPVVRYRLWRVAVIQAGAQEGRTVVSPTGAPTLVGVAADQALFESRFLAVLNGG